MMVPEIWVTVAAAFLGIATVTGGMAMLGARKMWDTFVIGARVAALAALIVTLIAAVMVQGRWTAADPRQAMLSLVAAMLAVQLVLAWRLGAGAGPVVDVVALVLSLVGVFAIPAGTSALICGQQASLFQAHWVLFSLGGGSVWVAGSAGLMLALRQALARGDKELRLPGWIPLYGWLAQATVLALVALGGGLVIGVWWAWRTSGMLLSGNAHEVWMAVAWLTAAMSLLSWQLDGRRSRWAAGLALVAAAAALAGLLFPVDVSLAGI